MGPATRTRAIIDALAENGMNVARINLSHGTRDEHRAVIRLIRDINGKRKTCGKPEIGILMDTRGPEIRTGDTDKPFVIVKGQDVIFSSHPRGDARSTVIEVNYDGFANDVRETDRILIDNGEIILDVVSIEKNGDVLAKARGGGIIGSRRHVNLPGADIDLPSITDADWEDIAFGVREEADFVALSFMRTAEDVTSVRQFLTEKKSSLQIISKIETKQAVENIQEIVHASDAIMIARGDLGAELPFETLPVIQDEIVMLCRSLGKPVIVATHMLESMIHQPTPTRAEVTDIAHAATTGADATMLSGETASGKNPLLALDAMDRVLRATEQHLERFSLEGAQPVQSERQARAEAAKILADSTHATSLLVFTRTGQTARDLAKFRPHVPIFAFTHSAEVARGLQVCYGVVPLQMTLDRDPETTVLHAIDVCKQSGSISVGDRVVVVSDAKAHEKLINTVQMRVIA